MDYVIERTHVIDHPKFLAAGPLGRDLWEWGMKYSGRHELDGELPHVAVLASSWGAGGKKNRKVADTLVDVGLWERTENGYRILQWSEQGNKTRAQLEDVRRFEREKKRDQRGTPRGCPSGTPAGTPSGQGGGVLISPSRSSSVESSSGSPPADVKAPAWADGVFESVEMSRGGTIDRQAAWGKYAADRAQKGVTLSEIDFRGFVWSWVANTRDRGSGTKLARGRTVQPYQAGGFEIPAAAR